MESIVAKGSGELVSIYLSAVPHLLSLSLSLRVKSLRLEFKSLRLEFKSYNETLLLRMLLCAKSPPITAILLNQAHTWFTKIYFLRVGMHACIFVSLPALIM